MITCNQSPGDSKILGLSRVRPEKALLTTGQPPAGAQALRPADPKMTVRYIGLGEEDIALGQFGCAFGEDFLGTYNTMATYIYHITGIGLEIAGAGVLVF